MTNQNGRKHLPATEISEVLSYVKTRADLARQKGTTRAVVDELIVLLLARGGLRPHELCAMRIGDLPGTHGETALLIRESSKVTWVHLKSLWCMKTIRKEKLVPKVSL